MTIYWRKIPLSQDLQRLMPQGSKVLGRGGSYWEKSPSVCVFPFRLQGCKNCSKMPSGMSICQPVPPKFKPDKGPFRAAHCCYENREMMICHKWKRAEWFCRKADGKWNINCYLRVEGRSERFIPNVGASRVDKNLKWDLMGLWFLIYFRKSLKRPSFQLGTNGSKKKSTSGHVGSAQ